MKSLIWTLLLALLFPSFSIAQGFKGSIDFTPQEQSAHRKHIATITKTGRRYLEDIWNDHLAFHRRYGVSKYYGDRSPALNTREKRIAALKQAGASPALVDQLQPSSCVGLTLKSLAAGFKAPGDPDLANAWGKIEAYTRLNNQDGSALLNALQKLGWRILYWNPSPKDNERWDAEDGTRPSRGGHAYRYGTVMSKNTYYFNKVDDKALLVNFGTTVPGEFKSAPYFVGVAHTGYHVFPGFQGEVIEAHSMRSLASKDNLEKAPFNPLGNGGAPRWTPSEKYRSGIVGVPPR
jgi:hypothetical protein